MSGRIRWEWVSPVDNSTTILSEFENNIEVVRGISGYGAPALRLSREQVPGMPGARTRQRNHEIAEIQIPIIIAGSDVDDLEDKVRILVRRLNGINGDGTLRRTSIGGRVSELKCTCTDGLRLDQAESLGPSMLRTRLTFQADDPYWLGEVQTDSFTGSAGSSWFPLIPLRLAPSSILGDVTIFTDSDVTTYPIWTIVGPALNPVFTNKTTGETFAFTAAIAAGQTVVVDTREYQKQVIGPDGSNWFSKLTYRELWGLVPGMNEISLVLGNANAGSYVAYAYQDRRLMP